MIARKILVFGLTFISYALIHAVRTSWAYVKPYLQQQPISFDKKFLGILDMVCLLSLAINLKVFGWIGDKIGYKLFLLIGMVTLTLAYLVLSLLLLLEIKHTLVYMLMLGLIGLFSCTGWPSCLSIMSIFYPAKQNGFLLSLWSGCSQFGDLIALAAGYFIIYKAKYPSEGIMVAISVMMIGMILINWIFLNPDQQKQSKPQNTNNQSNYSYKTKDSNISANLRQLQQEIDNQLQIIQNIQTNIQFFHSIHSNRQIEKSEVSLVVQEEEPINFINVWMLPSVASYVLCFGCMKSVNSIMLNWLVAYLYEIGLKSYLSSLTTAWTISCFIGTLMMGYFNRTVNRMGLIIPLLISSLLFIMLANQAKQIGIYVYFVTITIAGLCFGGPYGLVGSKVALSLANQPEIKSRKGAMGIIISLIQAFGQLSSALSMIVVPLIGLNYFFYIPFVMSSLSAGILLYQHLKQQEKKQKAEVDKREWQLRQEDKSKCQSTQLQQC